jgi:arginine/serine-rich splicing factor 4/5/6
MDNETSGNADHDGPTSSSESNGNMVMRPVFLGNLNHTYTAEQACEIFERPISPNSNVDYGVMSVERVDLKKGYCFVFLKDAINQEQKSKTERFVSDINGM